MRPETNTQRRSRLRPRLALTAVLAGTVLLIQPISGASAYDNPAPVALGSAGAFTVLAGSTVTNTNETVVSADAGIGGNLGVSPGSAVTGFPPGVVDPPGEIHAGDATAGTAQTSAVAAYNDAAGRTPDVVFDPVYDLGGESFTAGVYKAPTSLALTGSVTLDAEGNPDAVFIFQVGSTLVTAASSTVLLVDGAQACNVFWQVGSSATLGASSTFNGTIIALTSVSVGNAVDIQGRLLAGSGAVTLDGDTVNTPACAPEPGVPLAPLLGPAGTTLVVVAAFLAGTTFLARRRTSLRLS
jgi:hypothetical protein